MTDLTNITTPAGKVVVDSSQPLARLATAIEVLAVYAAILLYVWDWQFTYPRVWMVLFTFILVSHLVHRDNPRHLGLTATELRANATTVLPLVLALYLPLLLYGFARHILVLIPPGKGTLFYFTGYGSWCFFQQYLAQSYFHNRLMSIMPNRHLTSSLVALMFGAAHIPNPILTVVTAVGGFIFAEAFARHRNIWPLALAQTAGGFLIAAIVPPSLIRNMRVGPGYFFYGLH